MIKMEKSQGCFWIPLFGIISVVFLVFAIIINGAGHGPLLPVIVVASPSMLTLLLLPSDYEALFVLLTPFYWMGEVGLALCRNKYCKWAFWISVLGKYIVMLTVMFSWEYSFQYFWEMGAGGAVLFVVIPYIGVQVLLWFLFLRTWKQKPKQNEDETA